MLSFDGRVLEVFGLNNAVRYHVNELDARVKGPDKRALRGHHRQPANSRRRPSFRFCLNAEADAGLYDRTGSLPRSNSPLLVVE